MEKVKVKICGITSKKEALYISKEAVDYVGFVFAKSKRQVENEKVIAISKVLPKKIIKVGVFVNEDPDFIISLLNNKVIDMAQLHGEETKEIVTLIQKLTRKRVIKGITRDYQKEVSYWENTSVDFLLLDSGKGSGLSFDWSMIPKCKKPFFLAGGLDANNVCRGINTTAPYGIDVSSGVEENGKKSKKKIRKFMNVVGGCYEKR